MRRAGVEGGTAAAARAPPKPRTQETSTSSKQSNPARAPGAPAAGTEAKERVVRPGAAADRAAKPAGVRLEQCAARTDRRVGPAAPARASKVASCTYACPRLRSTATARVQRVIRAVTSGAAAASSAGVGGRRAEVEVEAAGRGMIAHTRAGVRSKCVSRPSAQCAADRREAQAAAAWARAAGSERSGDEACGPPPRAKARQTSSRQSSGRSPRVRGIMACAVEDG